MGNRGEKEGRALLAWEFIYCAEFPWRLRLGGGKKWGWIHRPLKTTIFGLCVLGPNTPDPR